MLVLGIETSCDDTAVAFVRDGRLLGEIRASQTAHGVFGGVVPEIAAREHLRLLHPILKALPDKCGVRLDETDAVAVARGPGLLGSLLMGLGAAKGLALALDCPVLGVNHLCAHLLAVGLEAEIPFPCLGLLASGGHTHLYRMDSPFAFTLLGRTLDDAAGEAFDKAAKMLNLPYPGGVFIDHLAKLGTPDKNLLPRPYLDNQNLDFSFSGLKTAVAVHLREHPGLRLERLELPEGAARAEFTARAALIPGLADFCASLNHCICDTLRVKVGRALDAAPDLCGLVVAGGVAANSMLRDMAVKLTSARGIATIIPSHGLCADNAAMIAYTGWLLAREGWRHGLDVDAIPRGRKVPWDFVRAQGQPPGLTTPETDRLLSREPGGA